MEANLKTRVIVAVLGGPVIFLAALLSRPALGLLLTALMLLAMREFAVLMERSGLRFFRLPAGVSGLAFLADAYFYGGAHWQPLLLAGVLALLPLLVLSRTFNPVTAVAVTGLGIVFTGLFLATIVLAAQVPAAHGAPERVGNQVASLFFLLVPAMDTGAFFVGRRWGRRPFFARISPRKTWEGCIAGILSAVGMAIIARLLYLDALFTWPHVVALGLVAGVLGTVGDLAVSRMKRLAGLKDTAHTIPGHGGVLDRFDSLFCAAPALYLYVRYVIF